MIDVIGVSFKNAGKIYYFRPGDLPVKRGLNVIVETARGTEFGTAVGDIKQIDENEFSTPVKPILRIATKRDKEQEEANREKEKKAYAICKEKIAARGLDMKLIGVEYTFDNSKVLFYFTADGRVDFRELVKDLAGIFRTRIELRQIGVRDETKIMGGIGICGRPLCCHIYLSDFAPVSIKMAKEQSLSLNPTKISGVCGRLMCCLKNEEDTYEYLNGLLPSVGDTVTAEGGLVEGEVHSVNVLRQTVKILVEVGEDEREIKEYKVGELTFEPGKRRSGKERKKDRKRRGDNDGNAPRPDENAAEILEDEIIAGDVDMSELEKLEELEEFEELEEAQLEEAQLEEARLQEGARSEDRGPGKKDKRTDRQGRKGNYRNNGNVSRRDGGPDKKDKGRYHGDPDKRQRDKRERTDKDRTERQGKGGRHGNNRGKNNFQSERRADKNNDNADKDT